MASELSAIGVDLGGTKIVVALVDEAGSVRNQLRLPTDVQGGPAAIANQISGAVKQLRTSAGFTPMGVGIGVAGQIEPESGEVIFGPNLNWHNVPLKSELMNATGLPVVITNDVRAATWGEWLYGAGKGCDDLICVFVGTGIGGGMVAGGRMLTGCRNTAGEVGHMTIALHGPLCNCGKQGCLEALAGGLAIARLAREAVYARPDLGAMLLQTAGGKKEDITAKTVAQAVQAGDPLARQLIDEVVEALVAGAVSLVNAFNPCRLVFGGGVIEGMPELVERVDQGVRRIALSAATESLQIVLSELGNNAGVIGAAALAMRSI